MQTDALDLLQEVQSHGQYTLAKLKGYLNRGNLTLVRKTKCLEGTINTTTVSNQVWYSEADTATLSKIMIPTQVRYIDGAFGVEVGRPLKTWPGGYPNLPKEYSYGTPYYYWLRNVHAQTVTDPSAYVGIYFGTWPIATEADKTLSIDAYLRPSTLIEDTAEPEVQAEWHDAIVYYAVSRIFGMFAHLQPNWAKKSVFYMSEFERMVGDANEFMSQQSDEPIELQDVYYDMEWGE